MNVHFKKDRETYADSISDAISQMADAVTSTLGPSGKTAIIDKGGNVPHVTKDGITVAESISATDPYINSVLSLLKEASRKTAKEVGDGTTTTMTLASNIILSTDYNKADDMRSMFKGMDLAAEVSQRYISASMIEADMGSPLLKSIAHTSSNGDEVVSDLVSQAVAKAGKYGTIDVIASGQDSQVDVTNGAHMNTAVKVRPMAARAKSATISNPQILLVEGGILETRHIVPALKAAQMIKSSGGGALVLIAKEFSDGVVNLVKTNASRGTVDIVLAEAEGFEESRRDILSDMAMLFDTSVTSTTGHTTTNFEELSPEQLLTLSGSAESVEVSDKHITFGVSQNVYDLPEIQSHIQALKNTSFDDMSESEVLTSARGRAMSQRMAKFAPIATIYVGGTTDAERVEIKDRVDDAVCAVASAINNGIVIGGGSMWLELSNALLQYKSTEEFEPYVKNYGFVYGFSVVLNAVKSVVETLYTNSGIDLKQYEDELLSDSKSTLNLVTEEVVNGLEAGILDPAAVAVEAIYNSIAVAKTILGTDVIIVNNGSEI